MSALPKIPELDLLPCFATIPPAAATTNEAVVDMLKVCKLSPPVPHISIIVPLFLGVIFRDNSCILSSMPSNSSSVSPFLDKLDKKLIFSSSLVFPDNTSDMISFI